MSLRFEIGHIVKVVSHIRRDIFTYPGTVVGVIARSELSPQWDQVEVDFGLHRSVFHGIELILVGCVPDCPMCEGFAQQSPISTK